MGIISVNFLYFVLISLLVFYILPGKLQNLFLLLVSYYFYTTWAWEYSLFLLGITIFNFFFAHLIQKKEARKKLFLRLGVVLNLVFLLSLLSRNVLNIAFTDFIRFFGVTDFEVKILLPLGVSYYVLECISYLIDVSRKQLPACPNFINFSLYLAYFPKLISGPIERAREFLPQLAEKRVVNNQTIIRSLALILIGLFRSVVFAGIITVLAPKNLFVDPLSLSSTDLVIGIIAVGLHLYNQFAGYTSIVRGVSGFFGIELSKNFAQPLFSKDFSDLWVRWHISLSLWLRDYIYLPLSRAFLRRNPTRTNKANILIPPMATMLASGIWHGGSINLIIWGAVMGVFIIIEQIINLFRSITPSKKTPLLRRILSLSIIMGLAVISFIPFNLSILDSKIYVYGIIIANNWQIPDFRLFVVFAIVFLFDGLQYNQNDEFFFRKWPEWIQSLCFALAIYSIIIVNEFQSAKTTFVYP